MSRLVPGARRMALPAVLAGLGIATAGCAVQSDHRFTDKDYYLLGPNMSYDAETGKAAFGNSAAVHEEADSTSP